MTTFTKCGSLAGLALLAFMPAANASTLFYLNQDGCTGTCGTGPFATVQLVQTTPAMVTVTETLSPNESYAGTGAGDALEFNVSGPIVIANITTGFGVGPAPDSASIFGSFLQSVTCNTCQGGQAGNPVGPLSFTVTSATGVTIADFLGNTGGYFFASDIVGTNGNTGNVAALNGTSVPEPLSLPLVGVGLVSLGLLRRRA